MAFYYTIWPHLYRETVGLGQRVNKLPNPLIKTEMENHMTSKFNHVRLKGTE